MVERFSQEGVVHDVLRAGGGVHAGQRDRTAGRALPEHVDVEALPGSEEVQRALHLRVRTAGDIAHILGVGDLAVAVAVHILDVSGRHPRTGDGRGVGRLGIRAEQAVGDEAHLCAHFLAGEFQVVRSVVRIARIVEPAAVRVCKHELGSVVETADVVVVAQGEEIGRASCRERV